jgi:hypothetical protein
MRKRQPGSISRHCPNASCAKCRARIRWCRRKAWHTHKSPVRMLYGKK